MIPPSRILLKEQIQEITEQLVLVSKGNTRWFDKRGIEINSKGMTSILNIKPGAELNHWNDLTNGLIINHFGSTLSFPFVHFYHWGEKPVTVNFQNCDLVEKLDGKIICVCFPQKSIIKPCWHTKTNISDYDYSDDTLQLADPLINKIKFNYGDVDYTYMFEMVNGNSLTKYDPIKHGLYLIGGRHLPTMSECSEDELDKSATRMNVLQPDKWSINGWSDAYKIMRDIKDCEGFIARDKTTGERVIIEKQYSITRQLKYTYKRLLPIYLSGDRDDYENRYPETKGKFDLIERSINDRVNAVIKTSSKWRNSTETYNRREIIEFIHAAANIPTWMNRIIMRLIYEKDDDLSMRRIAREEIYNISHSNLKDILGLKDEVG